MRWLGGQETRASQERSAAPEPCAGRAEHGSVPPGWMAMSYGPALVWLVKAAV